MAFYGLLLGLGVAELLLGFASILRHKQRPRLGWLTPLLGVVVLLQSMVVFIDAWSHLQNVSMRMNGIALPAAIGIVLFFVSVIVVPRDPDEWTDLDEYFLANRRWSIGLLIALNILILFYEVPGVAILPVYLAINFVGFGLLTGILLLRPRRAIAACLFAMILFYLGIYSDFSILRWAAGNVS